ncbi:MAG TPA: hypothetical protein VNO70_00590, partial [Blastocatellia bacterium]|nr:hypothetical protein [Blastocatellia bacterium]
LQEAERSTDIEIKMVAVRSSQYRVFGTSERIPHGEMAIVDLRDGVKPDDFAERFAVLDRHPMAAVMLVRKLKQ